MCGFIGQLGNLINRKNFSESLASIKHRGPDNLKYFFSESINLGFARLSIQDLGTLSNQPILSPSKKFVLVFNGEIYNHQLLRKYIKRKINKKLLASSNSDTITLLSLFEELGLKKTLNLIKGMFAIAIYYFETDSLYLIRDHFGQKPLYYSSRNSKFIFGSEIKALNYLNNKAPEIDKNSLISPFLQTYIPDSDRTLFKNYSSVIPGEIVKIKGKTTIEKTKYFNILELISYELYRDLNNIKSNELQNLYSEKIKKSISQHLISDVPIGTLFSAGLDSSIIAKVSEEMGNKYRIGFKTKTGEDEFFYKVFDEQSNSKTDFYEINEETEIINLPQLLYMYENINKPDGLILSNLTKKARDNKFKVLLNGDAADELFCGYKIYTDLYNKCENVENKGIRLLSKILRSLFPSLVDINNHDDMILNFYNLQVNNLDLLEPYLDTFQYKKSSLGDFLECQEKFSFLNSYKEKILMSYVVFETNNRLQRYLHRSDRYGMMNSVEMRAPFLDLDIIKLAVNTPIKYKIKYSFHNLKNPYSGKLILKNVAKKFNVPKEIIYRKKKGTTFKYYNFMMKIIEKSSLLFASEIFSIPESRLRSSILERHYLNSYPSYILIRYAYNILCTQLLAEIFVMNVDPADISSRFREILNIDKEKSNS